MWVMEVANIYHLWLQLVVWLVVLRINVDLAIFQPYLNLEAGDNQSLKIQVARPGIEPWSSCSASQELNNSATAAPFLWHQSRLQMSRLTTWIGKLDPRFKAPSVYGQSAMFKVFLTLIHWLWDIYFDLKWWQFSEVLSHTMHYITNIVKII